MIYMRLCVVAVGILLASCGVLQAQDAPQVGLKIRTLSSDLRKQHNLGADLKGALVTGFDPGGA